MNRIPRVDGFFCMSERHRAQRLQFVHYTLDQRGQFFRARTSAALTSVYKMLATRIGHRTQNRQVTDLFAGGAIVLLLLGGGLSSLWFRRPVP